MPYRQHAFASLTRFTASGYLGLAVLLGGASHPDVFAHLVLQLIALGLLAIAVFSNRLHPLNASQSGFVLLLMIFSSWTVLQLVPLPGDVWSFLGGREIVKDGADLLGTSATFPISMTPERTLLALMGGLPPAAAFVWICRLGWSRTAPYVQWTIPTLGALSAGVGLAQVFSGPDSSLYFYQHTNDQLPVGIFSNPNHQATLCLMGLPFVATIAARLRRDVRYGDRDDTKIVLTATLGFANLLGILAVGSIAGYILLGPVLLLSAALVARGDAPWRRFAGGIILAGVAAAAITFAAATPTPDGPNRTSVQASEISRYQIWTRSSELMGDHAMVGSGLGSFRRVYAPYEDPSLVTSKYINHAHNDYIQIIIESGAPGLMVLCGALILWIVTAARNRSLLPSDEVWIKHAAAISIMVIVLHSIVDYPLRTPAIATIAAACLAIMVTPYRCPSSRPAA